MQEIYSFETHSTFLIMKKALKDQSMKALLKKYLNKSLNVPNNAGLLVLSSSYILHLHIHLKSITEFNFFDMYFDLLNYVKNIWTTNG